MAENLTPEEVVEKINNSIDEKMQNTASSEDVDSLKSDIESLREVTNNTEGADEIKKAIAELEAKVEGIKEKAEESPLRKSLSEAIMGAYSDNIDAIKSIREKGGLMNLDVKVAGDMTITGNYSGGTVGLSTLEAGFTRIVRRRPFMRQLVNSAGITSKFCVWIEQANADPGEAGNVGEGVEKAQTDFDLVETSSEVKKIATWIKVSKEMVDDLPFMRGEINNELIELVELRLDQQILSGTGVGDELAGLLTFASAFAAGGFAASIPFANEMDVLRVAMAQIENANFVPNYIILNPDDAASMELNKASTGEYVYPMFTPQADGITRVKGIPVVVNPGVATGTYVVGDFTKSNLRVREDVNVQVGYINDDFTKNMMTVLAEARACHFVKTNHVNAFVQGTFATDIAAILQP